jgi:hypothetical protein
MYGREKLLEGGTFCSALNMAQQGIVVYFVANQLEGIHGIGSWPPDKPHVFILGTRVHAQNSSCEEYILHLL